MTSTGAANVQVFADLEALSQAAAAAFHSLALKTIAARGRFDVALSGGSTPRRLFELLAKRRQDWARIHLFWGDERCVDASDPQSNYHMARETLLSRVHIPTQNVHRMRGDLANPEEGAAAYEADLKRLRAAQDQEGLLAFDLILLGLGDDGHTASLFPGNPALAETQRWVVAVTAPETYATRRRISFTLPLINQARQVWFLVAGASKAEVVRTILQRPEEAWQRYPAARVQPAGELRWYLDEAALGQR